MTEQTSTRLSNREAYSALIQMVIQMENVSWMRLYNYLMGSSILVLAWATVFVSAAQGPHVMGVLLALCVIGIAAGPAWSELGVRARMQLEAVYQSLRGIEGEKNHWEPGVALGNLPMNAVDAIRASAPSYSKNVFLLRWAPLSFSGLNLVFLVATILR